MDRRVRYEVLQNQDEDEPVASPDMPAPPPPEPVDMAMVVVPVEEASSESPNAGATDTTTVTMETKIPEPPSYNIATELPSYEEAERTKLEEEERRQKEEENTAPDAGLDACLNRSAIPHDPQLGTDGMFLCTFMISFVFNWLGLLASLCLTQSVAGRLGAMAGFGLSLVKWVAIVKHNNWIHGVADADSWLWWLLIILGFLIFFRGCTQYIRIKYQWTRLTLHFRKLVASSPTAAEGGF